MHIPSVSRYMTSQPWTIEPTASIGEAHRKMLAHGIRHLPVVDNGELLGVVSERDLHLIQSLADSIVAVPVERIMSRHPFIVTSDSPLDEVAQIMADAKYGSAIVVGRDGVEGIFTTVDACRALAELLERSEAETLGVPSYASTPG